MSVEAQVIQLRQPGDAGADVQLEDGFLRLANELTTALALAPWTSASHPKLIHALIRVTYGLQRTDAPLGTAEWAALTGLSQRQVKDSRRMLERNGVIILVADFDARTHTPQTWRLQKDYTRWGRFAVSIQAVAAAEERVGQMLADTPPQGSQPVPGELDRTRVATPPPVKRSGPDPVNQSVPAPVNQSVPAPVNQSVPGRGSKSLNGNDNGAPKYIERQERHKPSIKPSQRAAATREEVGGEAGEIFGAEAVDVEDQISRIIILANKGAREGVDHHITPIPVTHGSRQVVHDWLVVEGIPPPVIEQAVYESAQRWKPNGQYKRINGMNYFDGAVRQAFDDWRTENEEAPDGGTGRDHGRGTKGEVRGEASRTRARRRPGSERRAAFRYE